MSRLGNTPQRQTNFYVERAKSFAFDITFVDKHGDPFSIQGAEVRLVMEEPKQLGGDEVINLTATQIKPEVGLAHFWLQARDLNLEPNEYPYDVTFLAPSKYSVPILKGVFSIGYNTDDAVDNLYGPIDLSNSLVVTMDGGNVVNVCLDYNEGLKGDSGPSGEILVVETITGPPGTMAEVIDLDSTPGRAALRFTIPRGDPGQSGISGTTDHGALLGLEDDDHFQYHNDARGDARYVQLSGGTMTGDLNLARDADAAMEPVTYRQFSDAIGGISGPEEVWVGPDTPPVRQQLWIDTDAPDPGSGAGTASGYYRHDQVTPLITWIVNHGLGYRPAVHTQDAVGNVLYGSVTHLSDSTLTITFAQALTGSAHCS